MMSKLTWFFVIMVRFLCTDGDNRVVRTYLYVLPRRVLSMQVRLPAFGRSITIQFAAIGEQEV